MGLGPSPAVQRLLPDTTRTRELTPLLRGQTTASVPRLNVLEEDVPCRHVGVVPFAIDAGETGTLIRETSTSMNRVTVHGVLTRDRSDPVGRLTVDGLPSGLEAALEFSRAEPLHDQALSALLVQGERVQFAIREAPVPHDLERLLRRLGHEVHRSIHPVLHLGRS